MGRNKNVMHDAAGKKILHPADAIRKKAKKRKLEKMKKERMQHFEGKLLNMSPENIQAEIMTLQDEIKRKEANKIEVSKVKRDRLQRLETGFKRMKEKVETKHQERLSRPKSALEVDFDELKVHRKSSIYYHPVMNPYGAPPTGETLMYRHPDGSVKREPPPLKEGPEDGIDCASNGGRSRASSEGSESDEEENDEEDDEMPLLPEALPGMEPSSSSTAAAAAIPPLPPGPAPSPQHLFTLPPGLPPLPPGQPPLPPGYPLLPVGQPPLPPGHPVLPPGQPPLPSGQPPLPPAQPPLPPGQPPLPLGLPPLPPGQPPLPPGPPPILSEQPPLFLGQPPLPPGRPPLPAWSSPGNDVALGSIGPPLGVSGMLNQGCGGASASQSDFAAALRKCGFAVPTGPAAERPPLPPGPPPRRAPPGPPPRPVQATHKAEAAEPRQPAASASTTPSSGGTATRASPQNQISDTAIGGKAPPPPPRKASAPAVPRMATLFTPTALRTKRPVPVAGGAQQVSSASLALDQRNTVVLTELPRVAEKVNLDQEYESFMRDLDM